MIKKLYLAVPTIIKIQATVMNLSQGQLECIALVKVSHISYAPETVTCIYTIHILQKKIVVALMVRLDSIMVLTMQVVEWRCVWKVYGGQCVMMDGTEMMLTQCVDNWDIMKSVNYESNMHA